MGRGFMNGSFLPSFLVTAASFARSLVIACLALAAGTATASAQPAAVQAVPATPAPSLDGGVEWVNVAGGIRLPQLRGKLVVLDFWTYCCINCLQTLPALKQLEEVYPNEVVVIGVHAPKFFGERDSDNVREAIARYEIEHPVINDALGVIARNYAVEGWPSIRIIDPQGNLIGSHYGEATFAVLDDFVKRAVAKYRREGTLDVRPLRFATREPAKPTPLRFPGKILADSERGLLFVADSGHHRIIATNVAGKLLATIGSGRAGKQDGSFAEASFSNPQGMALREGKLYVADTGNHMIRAIDLVNKRVKTIAGNGDQAPAAVIRSTARATGIRLASPWDLCLVDQDLYIAMAGVHQIWRMRLNEGRLHTLAGNGVEDIVDGPLLPRVVGEVGFASFAQPSGLASDGQILFVADSEGSSVRAIPLVGKGGVVTVLGNARLTPTTARLFTFGDRVGPAATSLLQHPIGVAAADGELFIADTYNNKIKSVDLATLQVRVVAGDQAGSSDDPPRFNEPAGLAVAGDELYVADTNNHAIRVINRASGKVRTLSIAGLQPPAPLPREETIPLTVGDRVSFPARLIAPRDGLLPLAFKIQLPAGFAMTPDVEAVLRVTVREGDPLLGDEPFRRSLAIPPDGRFNVELPIAASQGEAKLDVSLAFYYCATDAKAICRQNFVTWTGPVRLTSAGRGEALELDHAVRVP